MDAAPAQVDAELPLRFAPAQSREQVQVDAALTQADMMVVRVVLVALLAALVVATRVVTVPVERRCQPGGEEQKGLMEMARRRQGLESQQSTRVGSKEIPARGQQAP